MSNSVSNKNYSQTMTPPRQQQATPVHPEAQNQYAQATAPQELQADTVSFSETKEAPKGPNGFLLGTAIAVPTYCGFYAGTNYLNSKMRGEYSQTMLGKLSRLGNSIEENKFYRSTIGRVVDWSFSAGKWIDTHVIEKSSVLKAFKTPVAPVWEMAKAQAEGLRGLAGSDCKQIVEEVITQYAKKDMEKNAKSANLKADNNYLQRHANEFETAKNKYLKKLFGLTKEDFAKISKDPGNPDNLKQFKAAFKHADKEKVFINLDEIMGQKIPKILHRTIPAIEQVNKIEAVTGSSSMKSKGLGKLLPKIPLGGMESFAGGGFGGKLALLLGTIFVTMAGVNTIKEKGGAKEKTKKFAEEFTYFPSFLLTMPLAAMAMYGTAGLKYTGATTEKINVFKSSMEKINETNKAGGYRTKAEHKKAVLEAKKLLQDTSPTKLQRAWHKPFRWIGNALSVGLDRFDPWIDPKATKFKQNTVKALHGTKNYAGGIGRLGLILFAITPFLTNMLLKIPYTIFGKPKSSMTEEELAKLEKKNKIRTTA